MLDIHLCTDSYIWRRLQERFFRQQDSSDGSISDIYDGEGYKRFSSFLKHPAHVSLLLNTDGVAIYRSSSVSIWPVWGVVNELPASIRYVLYKCALLVYCSTNFCLDI